MNSCHLFAQQLNTQPCEFIVETVKRMLSRQRTCGFWIKIQWGVLYHQDTDSVAQIPYYLDRFSWYYSLLNTINGLLPLISMFITSTKHLLSFYTRIILIVLLLWSCNFIFENTILLLKLFSSKVISNSNEQARIVIRGAKCLAVEIINQYFLKLSEE